MLYLMDALFKGFECVFLFDVHRALRDDRTAIVLFVGEMNGNARDLHTRFERITDRMRAHERGQQCWVKIDDTIGKCMQDLFGHFAHVTSHDHVLRTGHAEALQR